MDNPRSVSAISSTIRGVQLRIAIGDGHRVRTLSIRAAHGARWDTVRDLVLPAGRTDYVVEYAGTTAPLRPDLRLGVPPLVNGAVISPGRSEGATALSPVGVQVAAGPDAGGCYVLPAGGRLTLGREQWCDLVIDDPGLSRHHLTISATRAGILVEDAVSTNGTRLGGELINGPTRWPPGVALHAGATTLVLHPECATVPRGRPDGAGTLVVTPRARPVPGIVPVALKVPDPAPLMPPVPPSVLGWLLPMAVSVLLALILKMPALLLFGLMAPAMSLGTYAGERRRHRKACVTAQADRKRAESEVRDQAAAALALEEQVRAARTPDLATLITAARTTGPVLWSRADGPPLCRVGVGRVTSAITVDGVARTGDHFPLEIDLSGGLTLIGPPELTRAAARSILVQLAVTHPPSALAIQIAGRRPGATNRISRGTDATHHPDQADAWEWVTWLPHTRSRTGARPTRTILVHDLSDPQAAGSLAAYPGPAEEQQIIPIVLCRSESTAPDLANFVLFQDTRVRAQSPGWQGEGTADLLAPGRALRTARVLAGRSDGVQEADTQSIPTRVEFSSMTTEPVEPDAVTDAWIRRPRSTRFALGQDATGTLSLDLATDGPHALVAGTTGAGKSELLRTMVASLALVNRPDELVMVLVDYKGGSAFAEASDLPHVVGVITDLDPHLADRALTSLTAELKRRERILAAAGATDLPAYQAQDSLPPLPRLVLLIDEFRALAEELPSFLEGLVRIAALGRSLGVHLVLATQRPGGVITADVRANVNLRIALRVRDGSDSYDVIDSPAAADLPEGIPGRALVRTGASPPRTFQVASTSAPAASTARGAAGQVSVKAVRDLWAADEHDDETPLEAADAVSPQSALAAVIAATTAAAERLGAVAPASPWLTALPECVTLGDLATEASDNSHAERDPAAYSVPLLLTDLPSLQTQPAHHWQPLVDGHLGIVGAARTGRSTLARTVLAGLLRRDPDDVHVYVFDPSGSLGSLADAPHVGALITASDVARGSRVIDHLTRLVAQRQRDLAAASHTSLTEQRRASSAPWPLVVLAIDGWPRFVELFGEVDRGRGLEQVLQVLREGRAVGVVAVLTGDRSLLSGQVAAQLSQTWSLRLTDSSDLLMAGLTRAQVPVSMPPGRLIRLRDGVVGQVAVLGSSPEGGAQVSALNAAVEAWAGTTATTPPVSFRPLPRTVPATTLPTSTLAEGLVIGRGGDDAAPVHVPLGQRAQVFGVIGPPSSGRTTTLTMLAHSAHTLGWRTLAVSEAHVHDPGVLREELSLLSAQRTGLLVLLDGLDRLSQQPAEDVLLDWLDAAPVTDQPAPPRLLVVCGGAEDFGGFRGLASRAGRERHGLILHPTSPADGTPLGVSVSTGDEPVPGRGVLVIRGRCSAVQVGLPKVSHQ